MGRGLEMVKVKCAPHHKQPPAISCSQPAPSSELTPVSPLILGKEGAADPLASILQGLPRAGAAAAPQAGARGWTCSGLGSPEQSPVRAASSSIPTPQIHLWEEHLVPWGILTRPGGAGGHRDEP